MKTLSTTVLSACLMFSYNAFGQEWKNECVGYYQLQLPAGLEVALYPIEDFVNPDKRPESANGIKVQLYGVPEITFRKNYDLKDIDAVQAQFTEFYYGNYELGISTEGKEPIDWSAYRKREEGDRDFAAFVAREYELRDLRLFDEPLTPEAEFKRKHGYLTKEYPDAFSIYTNRTYSVFINKDNRLYHFWKESKKDTSDKSPTAEKQLRDNEPEVLSLLNRFRARKLYEVPTEQGFCLPYGFIVGDSGHEKRNMAVTYRLKDHPEVSIFFQDSGTNPGPGKQRPDDKKSAKDYVTYLWNVEYGHSFRDIKLFGKGFSSPTIDNRKGTAAFAKFTRYGKEVDYGYVAYVKSGVDDNEPGLLFYVIRDSRQAKNQPSMDKDELEKLAEHIVSSVKRR
ncbi:hypothetical protein LVQ78_22415 [Buttiauxella sp. A2-C2_NF]|uniref:T6SS immunity protein Tli4 family protein n=1 Tax=Buttiauxella ferragutiae TaxID=82989 RepID=UPI001E526DD3|nr:T6SS immunity protein Tli4 family protein [Buttiauxella ferragutiae]MCE0828762.1 hypothetical protein [Buttiauxella ferragutiae]